MDLMAFGLLQVNCPKIYQKISFKIQRQLLNFTVQVNTHTRPSHCWKILPIKVLPGIPGRIWSLFHGTTLPTRKTFFALCLALFRRSICLCWVRVKSERLAGETKGIFFFWTPWNDRKQKYHLGFLVEDLGERRKGKGEVKNCLFLLFMHD